ncbi:MAG TPA: TAXI family TRAP transporter solute-binding subunit [Desulfobacteraceae bacterium]|nr:TAXI family TRAP transporter solute-binding subunit [Desulfobacteraceae bacterium]HPJ69124.1 TAXI family TRAP transporter solute-binding subunit [Desulfobacteraceae bacterium]HPQ29099.1 TAXI family TRAP transporter solute-binding subunit [Desulfobacteraceae bacterium]
MKSITVKFALCVLCLIFTLFLITFTAGSSLARTEFISIGTGGTGGVYYPYGGGVAEIWTKYVKGVRAVAEVTGASVENTKLCDRGETLFGEIMNDVAYQAYNGIGKFKDKPQKILGMFEMYPHHFQIVTLMKSDVNSIYDIKGKKVSVGAPASGTEYKTNLILQEALGIPYRDFNVFRLSFTETANALKDGTIEVGIWDVAAPTSSIMDLATTHKIKMISFTPEEIKKIVDKFPFYSEFTLPAGTYNNQDYDVRNPSVWNTFICNADVDEELVYRLTKAVFEHQDYMMKIHPFAKYTTPENAVKHAAIPLHPGSIRYLKEKGITVPDHLIPK